jgi:hypothetical protein
MDFLQYYGNDFRQHFDRIEILSPESETTDSSCDPRLQEVCDAFVVILDPLQRENNVGKSCYRISQVLREFSEFLGFLTALIVRGSMMTPSSNDTPNKSNDILRSVLSMKTTVNTPRTSGSND